MTSFEIQNKTRFDKSFAVIFNGILSVIVTISYCTGRCAKTKFMKCCGSDRQAGWPSLETVAPLQFFYMEG